MANGTSPAALQAPTSYKVHQPEIYSAGIITISLAICAVTLRFVSKKALGARLWLDDWFILGALCFAIPQMVVSMIGYSMQLTKENLSYILKGVFVCQVLYRLSLVLTKYSILALYWRLFNKRRYMRIAIYIILCISTAWGVSSILTTALQCSPIHGFWDRTPGITCNVHPYALFISTGITNTVTDAALLLLPLPVIYRLKTELGQKLALSATFFLGIFVCVISAVRMIVVEPSDLEPSTDIQNVYAPVIVWTQAETNIAIVCACLSSLRPVLVFFATGRLGLGPGTGVAVGIGASRTRRMGGGKARWEVIGRERGSQASDVGLHRRPMGNEWDDLPKRVEVLDINTTNGDLGLGVTTTIRADSGEEMQSGHGITVKRDVVIT